MDFSSKLLENAVNEVSQLPGIGKRTALRLVLHLLKQPASQTAHLSRHYFKCEMKLIVASIVIIYQILLFVKYAQVLREMSD